MYDYIVFCDFDGTASAWETSEGMLCQLIGKEGYDKKMKQLVEDGIGTSQGIKELYQMITSDHYPQFQEYVKTIRLRNGFLEFLQEMKSRNIPVVLVSGATREMVYGILEPYQDLFLDIYCCQLDHSQKYFSISSDFDDGVDLLRKERVMDLYEYKKSIFIGDSYTDMNPAQAADIVFARDRLKKFLDEKQVAYFAYDDFYPVIETVKKMDYRNPEETK